MVTLNVNDNIFFQNTGSIQIPALTHSVVYTIDSKPEETELIPAACPVPVRRSGILLATNFVSWAEIHHTLIQWGSEYPPCEIWKHSKSGLFEDLFSNVNNLRWCLKFRLNIPDFK